MNVLVVSLENRPGELAALLERLADAGVNVMLAAVAGNPRGTVMLVADDDVVAEEVLTRASYDVTTIPAVKVRAANRPAEGAAFCRVLADAGVNIELLLPLEITPEVGIAVLAVDDPVTAERVLADRIVPD